MNDGDTTTDILIETIEISVTTPSPCPHKVALTFIAGSFGQQIIDVYEQWFAEQSEDFKRQQRYYFLEAAKLTGHFEKGAWIYDTYRHP